jgi:hypothetical protein
MGGPICNRCRHHWQTPTMSLDMCGLTTREIGPRNLVDGKTPTRTNLCREEREPLGILERMFGHDRCGPDGLKFEGKGD